MLDRVAMQINEMGKKAQKLIYRQNRKLYRVFQRKWFEALDGAPAADKK